MVLFRHRADDDVFSGPERFLSRWNSSLADLLHVLVFETIGAGYLTSGRGAERQNTRTRSFMVDGRRLSFALVGALKFRIPLHILSVSYSRSVLVSHETCMLLV
jgi:hypothetical protein